MLQITYMVSCKNMDIIIKITLAINLIHFVIYTVCCRASHSVQPAATIRHTVKHRTDVATEPSWLSLEIVVTARPLIARHPNVATEPSWLPLENVVTARPLIARHPNVATEPTWLPLENVVTARPLIARHPNVAATKQCWRIRVATIRSLIRNLKRAGEKRNQFVQANSHISRT